MREELEFIVVGLEAVGNVVPLVVPMPKAWSDGLQVAFAAVSLATLAFLAWSALRTARNRRRLRTVARKGKAMAGRAGTWLRPRLRLPLAFAAVLGILVVLQLIEQFGTATVGLSLGPVLLVLLGVAVASVLLVRGLPGRRLRNLVLLLGVGLALLALVQVVEAYAGAALGAVFGVLVPVGLLMAYLGLARAGRPATERPPGSGSSRARLGLVRLAVVLIVLAGYLVVGQLAENLLSGGGPGWLDLAVPQLIGLGVPVAAFLLYRWLRGAGQAPEAAVLGPAGPPRADGRSSARRP